MSDIDISMPTPPLSPEERSLRSSIAGHTRWATAAPGEASLQALKGQAGLLERFARQADPEGRLPEADRLRRAESLRRAHMARLSLASARARRKRGAA